MPPRDSHAPPAACPEEQLERGELLFYPQCPFPMPAGDDLAFLLAQRVRPFSAKNIRFDPQAEKVAGQLRQGAEPAARLQELLSNFSRSVTAWLLDAFPRYGSGCIPVRATFCPEEEATLASRLQARNDLLHIDAFRDRPTNGRRLLRVFVNVNPHDPRVWATAEPFAQLLAQYGPRLALPRGPVGGWVARIFRPSHPRLSDYDAFMLRFQQLLKDDDSFQEKARKRLWSFPPGSAWVAMTDACSHAVLRGRFALEHSFFIDTDVLALPHEAPAALLSREFPRVGSAAA